MQAKRSAQTELHDLEYRCHFIGVKGAIEGVRLFSSPDDAAAALEGLEQARERVGSVLDRAR